MSGVINPMVRNILKDLEDISGDDTEALIKHMDGLIDELTDSRNKAKMSLQNILSDSTRSELIHKLSYLKRGEHYDDHEEVYEGYTIKGIKYMTDAELICEHGYAVGGDDADALHQQALGEMAVHDLLKQEREEEV